MAGQDPVNDCLPTDEGGYQLYKAAGKLTGRKALITGGDSGIGRAIAILYAMEGADSTIVYTPEEQEDAEKTQELVREKGGHIHLIQADLRSHQACKNVVEKALEAMGRINILVLNHGFQMMQNTIAELSECAPPPLSYFSRWRRISFNKPQGTMDQNIRYKHPPIFLPLEICASPNEAR